MLLSAEKERKTSKVFFSSELLKAYYTSFSFFKNGLLQKIVICHPVLLFKLTPEVLHDSQF